MKKLSIVLIIVGISLILYPTLNRAYYDYKQDQVLKEWQESMENIDSTEENDDIEESISIEGDSVTIKNDKNEDNKLDKYILKIDKIDLYLPILNGATDKNLDISLARMNHTAEPGEIGNFAIAGHRSYTYGRHFNRLNEIKAGDKIDVVVPEGEFKYEVIETLVVEPDELWVLKGNGKDKLITLVTCTPIRKGTHRLIVRGKLIE